MIHPLRPRRARVASSPHVRRPPWPGHPYSYFCRVWRSSSQASDGSAARCEAAGQEILEHLFKFAPRDRRFLIEFTASDKQLALPLKIDLAVACQCREHTFVPEILAPHLKQLWRFAMFVCLLNEHVAEDMRGVVR